MRTLDNPEIAFSGVMEGIELFLRPVWTSILKEDEFLDYWDSSALKWTGRDRNGKEV